MSRILPVTHYDRVAMLLHWLMALALVIMLGMGLVMEDLGDPLRPLAYSLHKAVGVTLLLLALFRLGWRLTHRFPPFFGLGWQRRLVMAVHGAFYVLMIALPLSGWAMSSASPYPISYFGLFQWPNLPGVVQDKALREDLGEVHEVLALVMIGLILLHSAAAFYHHFVRHDGVLRRIIPHKWFIKQ